MYKKRYIIIQLIFLYVNIILLNKKWHTHTHTHKHTHTYTLNSPHVIYCIH